LESIFIGVNGRHHLLLQLEKFYYFFEIASVSERAAIFSIKNFYLILMRKIFLQKQNFQAAILWGRFFHRNKTFFYGKIFSLQIIFFFAANLLELSVYSIQVKKFSSNFGFLTADLGILNIPWTSVIDL
jgi:hypothetical protein